MGSLGIHCIRCACNPAYTHASRRGGEFSPEEVYSTPGWFPRWLPVLLVGKVQPQHFPLGVLPCMHVAFSSKSRGRFDPWERGRSITESTWGREAQDKGLPPASPEAPCFSVALKRAFRVCTWSSPGPSGRGSIAGRWLLRHRRRGLRDASFHPRVHRYADTPSNGQLWDNGSERRAARPGSRYQ